MKAEINSIAADSIAASRPELRSALAQGVARLQSSDVPSAALAAELLLMHVVQHDRAWLYAHPEYELTHDEAANYVKLVGRRSEGVPTQYLTGLQEFWGLEFEVGPGVLIPRPETEHVVEVALAELGEIVRQRPRVADIGTGSGCIAIALAHELPYARIIGTDISPLALEYAHRNAARNRVAAQIEFVETNLLDAFLAGPGGTRPCFDLIVSNPPYVGRMEAGTLPREVREHEPAEALFAGEQGLDLYPPLIDAAAQTLAPDGLLVVEIGYNGAADVRSLLLNQRWSDVSVTRDLAGIERVISARVPKH